MKTLGPIMLDLVGLELTTLERDILKHPQVGGVILFTRNYADPAQLKHLIQQIRAESHTRLLIAVDHEGGRVQRFREHFTQLPALGTIGALYDRDPTQAKHCAEQAGWLMATELLAFDIDFSFAPVLDIDRGNNPLIADRSFHHDHNIITELAKEYINGVHRAGMVAIGKHFPGHGAVTADSHYAIPHDPRSLAEISATDLIPFGELIKHGLDGIMPAHIVYSKVDANPAGFSPLWLQKILRDQLQFTGAIISDDLTMEGASLVGDLAQRTEIALNAGCDLLLICNHQADACKIIEMLEHRAFTLAPQTTQRLAKLAHSN